MDECLGASKPESGRSPRSRRSDIGADNVPLCLPCYHRPQNPFAGRWPSPLLKKRALKYYVFSYGFYNLYFAFISNICSEHIFVWDPPQGTRTTLG